MTSSSAPFYIAHLIGIILLTVITKGFLSFKNITDALAFYGVYHRHPINQIIHFFGVPMIILSLLIFLAHLKVPIPLLNINIHIPFIRKHQVNYATILATIYTSFYLHLDSFGGALYAPFSYFLYATAVNLMAEDQEKAQNVEKQKDISGKTRHASWAGT